MEETRKRRGRGFAKNHVGDLTQAASAFGRAAQGSIPALGRFLTAENIDDLGRLKQELEHAQEVIKMALGIIEKPMEQIQATLSLTSRNAELERQVAELASKLLSTGHSDKLTPEQVEFAKGASEAKKKPGRPVKASQEQPMAAA